MNRTGRGAPGRREDGFTLIELLIVVAIVGILTASTIPVMLTTIGKSRQAALASEGRRLYTAFVQYSAENGTFPSTSTPADRAFDRTTIAPLSNNGYFGQVRALTSKLLNNRVTAYDSPNMDGPDSQFWAVLTSRHDPRLVLLVASTDQYPGHVGTWYDGLYLINGADIAPVE